MKLRITTPLQTVVEIDDVAALRAEDESGSFGVLPSHTAFLTVLPVSVVSWRDESGSQAHAAVRGGVLRVDGDAIDIVTREAVSSTSLPQLMTDVLGRFREHAEAEDTSKTASANLNLAIIRQLQRYLEAGRLRVSAGEYRFGGRPARKPGRRL